MAHAATARNLYLVQSVQSVPATSFRLAPCAAEPPEDPPPPPPSAPPDSPGRRTFRPASRLIALALPDRLTPATRLIAAPSLAPVSTDDTTRIVVLLTHARGVELHHRETVVSRSY